MSIKVTHIFTYPIKSCGRLMHERMTLDARGLRFDRRWMVVDEAGHFLTQRELPRLAVIQPAFVGDELSITAPGMTEIRLPLGTHEGQTYDVVVWRDTCRALDEGDSMAAWFSKFLASPVRLVRMADDFVRPVDSSYARAPAQTGFADAFPLLLASAESLNDLNVRLSARGKAPIPMDRFRPNLVIQGGGAFAEDDWQRIDVGGVAFDVVKPCARCVTTTVDQRTGSVPDREEPLATLATFRKASRGVMFGQNIIHRSQGEICVGDSVEILSAAL